VDVRNIDNKMLASEFHYREQMSDAVVAVITEALPLEYGIDLH
jgi:hypothetical protein